MGSLESMGLQLSWRCTAGRTGRMGRRRSDWASSVMSRSSISSTGPCYCCSSTRLDKTVAVGTALLLGLISSSDHILGMPRKIICSSRSIDLPGILEASCMSCL